jgi:hypothetical protein
LCRFDYINYTSLYQPKNIMKDLLAMSVRGVCTFSTKSIQAQSLGALAMIIGNSERRLIAMPCPPEEASKVTIPTVMLRDSNYKLVVSHAKRIPILLRFAIDENPAKRLTQA